MIRGQQVMSDKIEIETISGQVEETSRDYLRKVSAKVGDLRNTRGREQLQNAHELEELAEVIRALRIFDLGLRVALGGSASFNIKDNNFTFPIRELGQPEEERHLRPRLSIERESK